MTVDPLITEDDIEAFISGHLDETRRQAIEGHLRDNPKLRAEVRLLMVHQEALRQIGREILEEPLPERFLKLLDDAPATVVASQDLPPE